MSKYWSNFVQDLEPYVPGEQPQKDVKLKLNTNENPYPPCSEVKKVINENAFQKLNLYPDPESIELKQDIANYHKLEINNVFVGNGSDEILAFIFYAFFKDKEGIFFPDITYSFYPVYCKLFDIQFEEIPLLDSFELDIKKFNSKNSGVIFPNPNAPTAIPISKKTIEELISQNQETIFVIDEAYVDFGTESVINLVQQYKNIIVTRSFSKSRSMAGMRLGYAAADKNLIEALNRVKNSFNSYPVDRVAQLAGSASIRDDDYFKKTCDAIIKTRENFSYALKEMNFKVFNSGANFLLIEPPKNLNAEFIFESLRQQGIYLRYFKKPNRLIPFLRVTIGTDEQMEFLLEKIKKLI